MPAPIFLLIVFFVLCGRVDVAQAETGYEVRQKRGFFVFEDFRQWINLRYRLTDSDSKHEEIHTTSITHAFEESYNAALNFAIYDDHLFRASLQGSVRFDQNRSKNENNSFSSDGINYQYNFSGIGLDKSPSPFTLRSLREINTVETTYMLPYTTDRFSNEIDATLRNSWLRSHIHLSRETLDISGTGNNSSTTTNSFSYSAQHSYKDISTTSASITLGDSTGSNTNGTTLKDSSIAFEFLNNLSLGSEKKYSLTSQVHINRFKSNDLPRRDFTFSEAFNAILGRALNLEAVYTYANSTGTDFEGRTREDTTNTGEVTLKHKLFNSLETNLRGKVSDDKSTDGSEKRYGGWADIRYFKTLPSDSRLSIGLLKGYEVVDRNDSSASATIIDEPHLGVHQGDVIDLPISGGKLQQVVSVKSRNPFVSYVEGVDYTVNLPLRRIFILSGGGVHIDMTGTGMDLYISYVVSRDSFIKYANDILTVSTDVGLYGSLINFGGAYSENRQSLISGSSSNLLQDSRSITVFLGGNYNGYNGRLTYRDIVSGSLAYKSFEGSGRAYWGFLNSAASLFVRDQYYMYDATSTSRAYNENMAELSATFTRGLFSNMILNLAANVADSRSDLRSAKDTVLFRADIKAFFNRLIVDLSGHTAWTWYSGDISREDAVYLDITRYF